jgi:hypothetical protein
MVDDIQPRLPTPSNFPALNFAFFPLQMPPDLCEHNGGIKKQSVTSGCQIDTNLLNAGIPLSYFPHGYVFQGTTYETITSIARIEYR